MARNISPPPAILSPSTEANLSNKKRKAQRRELMRRMRSPFPRSPRHGKHAYVQGDPNTIGHNR